MKARGADARGVAVIDDKTPDSDLGMMSKVGVRGIRLNLATGGTNDPAVALQRFQAALARMAKQGWHIQIYTNLAVIAAIKDLVLASPVPVVFDRRRQSLARTGQAGFSELIDLLRSGKAYVKISGAYRASTEAGLSGRCAARQGADRGECRADRVEHRLAASKFRADAALSNRRQPADESVAGLGARCRDPQDHLGRQPGAPL
jgi:Amidohydrolase